MATLPVTATFATSFASTANPTITLSNAPAGGIIVCVNGDTQYTCPHSISDNAGSTYTQVLTDWNTTGISMTMYVCKNFAGGSPTISPVMQSATTGEIIVLCVAGLNRSTVAGSGMLDPNVIGSSLSGGTTSIYVNQYDVCSPFTYPGDLVVCMSANGTNGKATLAGWDSVNTTNLTVLYHMSKLPGETLPAYTVIGSQDYGYCYAAVVSFQRNTNVIRKPSLRPAPFKPGLAR